MKVLCGLSITAVSRYRKLTSYCKVALYVQTACKQLLPFSRIHDRAHILLINAIGAIFFNARDIFCANYLVGIV